MTCKDFIEFLVDYVGGELPEAQKARFEEHIGICRSCVAYLSNYKDTVELAKISFGEPSDPVPGDVPEELVAAILAARKAGER